MSFSVTAPSFMPASKPWVKAESASSFVPPSEGSGLRKVVCSVFFQTGFCPEGDFCGFAHHLEELEFEARQQLLGMMADAVPAHFVAPRAAAASAPVSTFTMYGGNTAGAGNGRRPWQSNSGRTSPAALDCDEPPRLQLPARCRYPHAVPGTYYDHLNVKRNAAPEAIDQAYRHWRTVGYKAAKAIDQVKADAVDRLVVDAKNVLSNPIMRSEYDAHLPPATTPLPSPEKRKQTNSIAPTLSTASNISSAASSNNTAAMISAGMFDDIWAPHGQK